MKSIKKVFWSLVSTFILILSFFVIPFSDSLRHTLFPFAGILGLIFLILGGVLIYLTFKHKVKGYLKLFLLFTGFSSVGVLPCVILHNLVYALFILLFGENFWINTGMTDEPVFFILGLVVCPIVFLIGVIGSIVMFLKKK